MRTLPAKGNVRAFAVTSPMTEWHPLKNQLYWEMQRKSI